MKRRAFSLLEVIIVVGIVGVMSSLSIPAYREYQLRSDLDKVAQQVSQGLARAQLLAKSGERDAAWGFYVPAGVLYRGESYATRDSSFDQSYPMPSTIAVTGLLDVAYAKLTGLPSEVGDITLRALNNDERLIQVRIAVDSQAIATNVSSVLTICHHPGQPTQQTITIPESTWPTYQAQGDTMGACDGGGASSSAPAQSSSSIAGTASSSSSSVAGGGGGGGTCPSKFSVASSGLITLTANSSVTFLNKLALITFGTGGPSIPVHVCDSSNGGTSISPLFGGNGACNGNGNAYGNAVQPNGTDTTTKSLTSGNQLVLRVTGRYKVGGWLAFLETFTSADQTGHVLVLQNGASLSSYSNFGDQTSLKTYLQGQGLADASGQITISGCQLLVVTELGSLGVSTADFRDDVMLLTFN